MGPMKEITCTQLLKLTSHSNSCNVMTFTNGECYLHDSALEDYWEGDCLYKDSYVGYL
jgi:hypothetical protein